MVPVVYCLWPFTCYLLECVNIVLQGNSIVFAIGFIHILVVIPEVIVQVITCFEKSFLRYRSKIIPLNNFPQIVTFINLISLLFKILSQCIKNSFVINFHFFLSSVCMYMLLPGGMDMLARKAIFSFPGNLVLWRLRTEIAGIGYLCFIVRNIF